MNRSYQLFSLKYVIPQYHTLFNENVRLDEVIDMSRMCLKAIGNIALDTYSAKGKVKDFKFYLPCETYIIKSVTTEKTYNNDNLVVNGINSSSFVPQLNNGNFLYLTPNGAEQHINIYDKFGQLLKSVPYGTQEYFLIMQERENPVSVIRYNEEVVGKPKGTYINYNIDDAEKCLTFDITDTDIEVIYDTIIVDDEGLVMISEQSITAVCYYIKFLDVQRKFFQKIADANMLSYINKIKDEKMAAARVGERITDNDRDRLFSQMMTANRKQYNMPYRS